MPIEAHKYDDNYSARLTESGEIEIFTQTAESGREVEHILDGQKIRLVIPEEAQADPSVRCLKLSFPACKVSHPTRFVDSLTDSENSLLPPIPSSEVLQLKSWVRKAVRHVRA